MNHLFWGLLFCLLDLDVTVGSAVIGILPDAVGYFLLMKGMTALAEENDHFDKGRHVAFGLCIVSAILYGANLMNPDSMTRVWLWVLGLAEQIAMILLIRKIVAGLGQPEGLKAMWMILAVIQPLCHLLSWIPLVGPVCTVASAVTGVLFLATFWKSRK